MFKGEGYTYRASDFGDKIQSIADLGSDTSFDHARFIPEVETILWQQQKDTLQKDSVEQILRANPGLVPESYDPRSLGTWLNKEVDKKATIEEAREHGSTNNTITNGTIHMDTHNMEERPRYDGPNQRLNMLSRIGVYNSVVEKNGTVSNINMHDPENAPLLDLTREKLADGSFIVLLPYAAEPNTIQGCIDYAVSRVGKANVIAISAGVDEESDRKAQETGVTIIDQQAVMNSIDWNKLKEEKILPQRFPIPPKGSKGLTMLAGIIALKAIGKDQNTNVVFHDTDITNPEGYAALEHIALPYALPVGEIQSTYVARTGEGRNNEPWVLAGNMTGMSHLNPEMMKMSMLMGTFTWPLTGERALKASVAETLPWSSGMGIETTLNVNMAGIDLKNGERGVMQVLNPNPKMEDRMSPRDREFAIVFRCAAQLQALTKDVNRFQTPLHEWSLQQIGEYNAWYGGVQTSQAVPSGANTHQPNSFVNMESDYILPSVEQLDALEAIDWEAIQDTINATTLQRV